MKYKQIELCGGASYSGFCENCFRWGALPLISPKEGSIFVEDLTL